MSATLFGLVRNTVELEVALELRLELGHYFHSNNNVFRRSEAEVKKGVREEGRGEGEMIQVHLHSNDCVFHI